MANLSVTYNGLTMCPTCDILTPFVTRSSKYEYDGKKKRRVTTININGKITGDDFTTIDSRRSSILNAFSEDFQALTAGNYSFTRPKVDEVSFTEGNTGIIEFTISLTDYDAYFADAGLHDVKNEWSVEEGEDGVITCRHVVAARGGRYSGGSESWGDERDAIQAAKNYCDSLAYPNVSPTNVSWKIDDNRGWGGFGTAGFGAPWSTSYTYNRITGAYSIEEVWKQGKWSSAGLVQNLDITETHDKKSMRPTLDVSYTIETGRRPSGTTQENHMDAIRNAVPSIATIAASVNDSVNFGEISNESVNMGNGVNSSFAQVGDLPISYEIVEHSDLSKIEVKMTFDYWYRSVWTYFATDGTGKGTPYAVTLKNYYDDGSAQPYKNNAYLDYQISHSNDYLSQITTIDVACTLKCARGHLSHRKSILNSWYDNVWKGNEHAFLWALAKMEYESAHSGLTWNATSMLTGTKLHAEQNGNRISLHPEPLNLSYNRDPNTGEVTFNATYDNREWHLISKATHDQYWLTNGNMHGINPWGHLVGVSGDYIPLKKYQWDVSQKMGIHQMTFKMGSNGSSFHPDYLIFDLNNISKETTSVNVTSELAAGFYNWSHNDTKAFLEFGIGRVVNSVQLNTWESDFLTLPIRGDTRTNRVLENWETNKASLGWALGFSNFDEAAIGGKIGGSATWAQSPSEFIGQDGWLPALNGQGVQVERKR